MRRPPVPHLLMLAFVAACGVADREPAREVAAACGLDSSAVLSGHGIGDFQVGVSVDTLRATCAVVMDTTLAFGAEGMPERRVSVRLGDDTVEATIGSGRVWRIEVESPRFRTIDSIGVGTNVATLRSRGAEYLEYGEGGPFVRVPTHCGLSFELTGVRDFAARWEQVPDSAVVRRVLIIGCGASG